jgi:hypothetical protein
MTAMHEVTTTPPRELHGTLEALLSPEALGRLEGRTVTCVRAQPWTPQAGSASGCLFLRVETHGDGGRLGRYVVKRTSYAQDLIMRMTNDTACREVRVWQRGLLDRLPPEVMSPVVGAAVDGDGWALLMRDMTDALPPFNRWSGPDWGPATREETSLLLDGLAALHERYWLDPVLDDPTLGLCSLHILYDSMSPAMMTREIGSLQPLVPTILRGWALLDELCPPDIARLTRDLFHDLRPLCAALERSPRTLVHGDPKCANLGIETGADGRVVLLDWQFVTAAPPAVDLSWFLAMFTTVLPISLDEAIEEYRACLVRRLGSRFDECWWQPQLELALLGQFLRLGHLFMDRTRNERLALFHDHYRALLDWWFEHMRAGARWL